MGRTQSRRAVDRMARAARVAALAALAGAALSAQGCARATPAEQALASARRSMRALHSGPDSVAPSVGRGVHQSVIDGLRPHLDALTGAQASAAWGLMAQAQAGLAALDGAAALEAHARALNIATMARSAAGLASAQNALAAALEAPDQRAATTDLDQQARVLDAELGKATQARAKEAARLEALEAEAAEQTRLARARRVDVLARRAAAADAAPAERATGYGEAYEMSREAAAFERKAAEISAEAGLVRPLVGVHDLEIQRITRQRELVSAAKAQIEQSAAAALDQATAARADARAAGEVLGQRLAELDALLAGEATQKFAAAIARMNEASQSARNAVRHAGQGEAKLVASVALAGYQQALGDLHGARSQALASVSALMGAVEGIDGSIGDPAAIRDSVTRLAELRAQGEEAMKAAYDAARSALNSAGARGQTAERVKALADRLPGAPPAETPAETPEAAPEPDPEMPATPAENPVNPEMQAEPSPAPGF